MTVPYLDLSEIDLTQLKLLVERNVWREGRDHSRWVFRGTQSGAPLVYKIWNPGYIRRDNVLTGISSGLYNPDTVPALKAVIMSGDMCRGYVMAEGQRNRSPAPQLARALWEATWRSSYFLAQYRVSHTIIADGQPSLIDLEAVHAVHGEPDWPVGKVNIEDPDYADLIAAMQVGEVTIEEVRARAESHITRDRKTSSSAPWISRKARGARKRFVQSSKRWLGDNRQLIEL